jgi:hypothetical protein
MLIVSMRYGVQAHPAVSLTRCSLPPPKLLIGGRLPALAARSCQPAAWATRLSQTSNKHGYRKQSDVRFTPKSGHGRCTSACLLWANSGHELRHSTTSSAIASTPDGMAKPSALAVFRLMTNSNLVDCETGRSEGFSPLRTRPT